MKKNKTDPLKAKIMMAITDTSQEDYDGHTQFGSLTIDQRIEWLSGAVQLYYSTNKSINDKSGSHND